MNEEMSENFEMVKKEQKKYFFFKVFQNHVLRAEELQKNEKARNSSQ